MSHSRIESFPETKFFARGFGGRRRWLLHETLRGGYLWSVLARWLVNNGYLEWSEVYSLPVAWSKAKMVQIFRKTLDRLTTEAQKDVWLEKTPRHLHFIDVITEHLPEVKFVHIVRDGRAVVASIYHLAYANPKTWGHYQSVDRIIQRWNRCVHDSLRYSANDDHVIVSYDRLVDHPESALREVCSTLDISFEPAMTDEFHREAERVVKDHETWKAGPVSSSLEHRGLNKFRSVFSEEEQKYVESKLDWSLYRELGYHPL